MIPSGRLYRAQNENRSAIRALIALDDLTDEQRTELTNLTIQGERLDVEVRAALLLEPEPETRAVESDPEIRERMALRGRATLTNYLTAAISGRQVAGPELELRQAAHVDGIPIELFMQRQDNEVRVDLPSLSPTIGTGVNVTPILPMIFARSIMPRLGVMMEMVPSGAYSTMTVTTGLSAAAYAPGDPAMATASVLTPQTTTPHRVTGRLTLRMEDISLVGVANFESVNRQQLMLAMSAELDQLGLSGDNQGANPSGLLTKLVDPTSTPTDIVTWDAFVEALAGGIDGGPWSEGLGQVTLCVNAETMRLAETTFQSTATYKGEMSAAAYLRQHGMGFFSSARMPATATDIATAIRYRSGTMGLDGVDAMRVATQPYWSEVSIDDIYTDSASGVHHVTMHALVGDVIVQQAEAYQQISLKVS